MLTKVQIRSVINDIRILKEFPPSGQKKVLLVNHKKHGECILKIVPGESERVKREVDIITEYELRNVPKILSVEEICLEENPFFAIFEEYIKGLALNERLSKGCLSGLEGINLLRILLHIAVKLEEIQVVHRDIKPNNIICSENGDYYLIDFGIARKLDRASLTMTHAAIGPHTPGYGAPELFQYSKKDIDIRADLFSIGVVLFEALTGEHPFLAGDEMGVSEIWYKTNVVIPKNFQIEGDKNQQLVSFIQTLMQKHITRRPPTAKKALEWFETLLPTVQIGGA